MDILVQKETIGKELGVSLATVNNWIKTQVIPAPDMQNYYSRESFELIIHNVKNDTMRLASRANRSQQRKKEVCYLGITDKTRKKLLEALVADFESSNMTIDNGVLALVFAMLRSNNLIEKNWKANSCSKIDVLLSDWIKKTNQKLVRNVYAKYDIPNFDDDLLGAFYQSIQSVSQKSNAGSYYTPAELLKEITIAPHKTVLDPCCGSGGILLNVLTKKHDTSKIFARDTDETALKICFINLVLFFNDKNIASDISKRDITSFSQNSVSFGKSFRKNGFGAVFSYKSKVAFPKTEVLGKLLTLKNTSGLFAWEENRQFDFVITNPPWGSKYTKQQKDKLIALYPELETTEVFSISLYNALKMLKQDGELFFFLPHSFLNVAAHRNIRNYVFNQGNKNQGNKIDIKLLGNAFKGVLSESILIHITKTIGQKGVHIQNKEGDAYQLPSENIIPPDYIVSATSNAPDTLLIEKMYSTEHLTLQQNTIFALGIVTGNNKRYVLSQKTKTAEAIFRGKDIEKYRFLAPGHFIEFQPELYQQIAPIEYYSQKKIAYRFISDRLVVVLDNSNSLLLNSANLFIPKNYPMESIATFFNSDIYTFIFRKKFHSRKVLKSHLQNLPLPVLPADTHRYIYMLYNKTIGEVGEVGEMDRKIVDYQAEIDEIICKAFSIDKDQYKYIKRAV